MKAIRPARQSLLLALLFDAIVTAWGIAVVRNDLAELLFIVLYAPFCAWLLIRHVHPRSWPIRQPPSGLPRVDSLWKTLYHAATPVVVFAVFVAVSHFTDGFAAAIGAANGLALLLETLYVLKTVLEYERRYRQEKIRLWYGVYSYSPIRRVSSYYFPCDATKGGELFPE